jgi:hypothetical protein
VPRQFRQDLGGVAHDQWCDGQAEAGEAAVHGSGKTEFLFRIGPRHKRFGGLAFARPLLAVGGAKIPIHVAPTELARASGVMVAIHMALLTELDLSPSPKKRIGCRAHRLRKLGPGVNQLLQTRTPRHGGKAAGKWFG